MATQSEPETSRLVKSVWHLGLSLSATDTQNLRRLIRRFRTVLTAINYPNSPALLQVILPLAFESPSVLHGLLSLTESRNKRSSANFNHHHKALAELLCNIDAAEMTAAAMGHVHRVLASSLLLNIFAIGQCDITWSQHIRGMVEIVRATDRNMLMSTTLGRFLTSICAASDISALSIGRDRLSQKAWLSWMTGRSALRLDHPFTPLEITIGYPESFIDILAQVSELADDQTHCQPRWPPLCASTSCSSSFSGQTARPRPSQELEAVLRRWSLPPLPPDMSSFQQIALRTAWGTLRKACFLFLQRGCGFHSNLAEPMPLDIEAQKHALVEDILADLEVILDLCKTQHLSIGTAMMWPLAVVGSEGGHSSPYCRERTLALLRLLEELYCMEQSRHLAAALSRLWETQSQLPTSFVSLELICRDMNLIIPLG